MVKFVVITINYNNAEGLYRTLNSIQCQSYDEYEVLIIDAESKDASKDIIEHYSVDRRFSSIVEQDDGIYDGMNKGISYLNRYSLDSYVIFLNSGDFFYDCDVLLKVKEKVEFEEPDIVYGDSFNSVGGRLQYKKAKSHRFLKYGMHTHHQSIFYRSSLLKLFWYDLNYKIGADYKLTAQFFRLDKKFFYVKLPISIFDCGGLNQREYINGAFEQYRIRKELFNISVVLNVFFLLRTMIGMNVLRFKRVFT